MAVRTYKFRAHDTDHKWVYSDEIGLDEFWHRIYTAELYVDTLGLSSTHKDKSDKEIFVGDIVKGKFKTGEFFIGEVVFINSVFEVQIKVEDEFKFRPFKVIEAETFEIMGNVYDKNFHL